MAKITILTGHCYDCGNSLDSVLVLPDGLDLTKEENAYNKWYKDDYCKDLRFNGVAYRSFADWLIEKGARHVNFEEVAFFGDDVPWQYRHLEVVR